MNSIKNNKKKPIYPNYILNKDNSDNIKRYFRDNSKNYYLDESNNLFIKYYKRTKGNKKSNKGNYELKIVPFVKNLDIFLYEIHKETNHKDSVALRKELLNRNFYYKGIIKDTENIVNNCSICNMKNIYNNKVKSENINKVIIFNRPKYRYVGDITTIPNELKKK